MRVSIALVLFLVWMQAGAGMLVATGVAADMGINPNPGDPEALDESKQAGEQFSTSDGGGGTLFGLYSGLASVLDTIVDATGPAPDMIANAGVTGFFVDFVFSGVYLYIGLDLIGFLRSGGVTER